MKTKEKKLLKKIFDSQEGLLRSDLHLLTLCAHAVMLQYGYVAVQCLPNLQVKVLYSGAMPDGWSGVEVKKKKKKKKKKKLSHEEVIKKKKLELFKQLINGLNQTPLRKATTDFTTDNNNIVGDEEERKKMKSKEEKELEKERKKSEEKKKVEIEILYYGMKEKGLVVLKGLLIHEFDAVLCLMNLQKKILSCFNVNPKSHVNIAIDNFYLMYRFPNKTMTMVEEELMKIAKSSRELPTSVKEAEEEKKKGVLDENIKDIIRKRLLDYFLNDASINDDSDDDDVKKKDKILIQTVLKSQFEQENGCSVRGLKLDNIGKKLKLDDIDIILNDKNLKVDNTSKKSSPYRDVGWGSDQENSGRFGNSSTKIRFNNELRSKNEESITNNKRPLNRTEYLKHGSAFSDNNVEIEEENVRKLREKEKNILGEMLKSSNDIKSYSEIVKFYSNLCFDDKSSATTAKTKSHPITSHNLKDYKPLESSEVKDLFFATKCFKANKPRNFRTLESSLQQNIKFQPSLPIQPFSTPFTNLHKTSPIDFTPLLPQQHSCITKPIELSNIENSRSERLKKLYSHLDVHPMTQFDNNYNKQFSGFNRPSYVQSFQYSSLEQPFHNIYPPKPFIGPVPYPQSVQPQPFTVRNFPTLENWNNMEIEHLYKNFNNYNNNDIYVGSNNHPYGFNGVPKQLETSHVPECSNRDTEYQACRNYLENYISMNYNNTNNNYNDNNNNNNNSFNDEIIGYKNNNRNNSKICIYISFLINCNQTYNSNCNNSNIVKEEYKNGSLIENHNKPYQNLYNANLVRAEQMYGITIYEADGHACEKAMINSPHNDSNGNEKNIQNEEFDETFHVFNQIGSVRSFKEIVLENVLKNKDNNNNSLKQIKSLTKSESISNYSLLSYDDSNSFVIDSSPILRMDGTNMTSKANISECPERKKKNRFSLFDSIKPKPFAIYNNMLKPSLKKSFKSVSSQDRSKKSLLNLLKEKLSNQVYRLKTPSRKGRKSRSSFRKAISSSCFRPKHSLSKKDQKKSFNNERKKLRKYNFKKKFFSRHSRNSMYTMDRSSGLLDTDSSFPESLNHRVSSYYSSVEDPNIDKILRRHRSLFAKSLTPEIAKPYLPLSRHLSLTNSVAGPNSHTVFPASLNGSSVIIPHYAFSNVSNFSTNFEKPSKFYVNNKPKNDNRVSLTDVLLKLDQIKNTIGDASKKKSSSSSSVDCVFLNPLLNPKSNSGLNYEPKNFVNAICQNQNFKSLIETSLKSLLLAYSNPSINYLGGVKKQQQYSLVQTFDPPPSPALDLTLDLAQSSLSPQLAQNHVNPQLKQNPFKPQINQNHFNSQFSPNSVNPQFNSNPVNPQFSSISFYPQFSQNSVNQQFSPNPVNLQYTQSPVNSQFTQSALYSPLAQTFPSDQNFSLGQNTSLSQNFQPQDCPYYCLIENFPSCYWDCSCSNTRKNKKKKKRRKSKVRKKKSQICSYDDSCCSFDRSRSYKSRSFSRYSYTSPGSYNRSSKRYSNRSGHVESYDKSRPKIIENPRRVWTSTNRSLRDDQSSVGIIENVRSSPRYNDVIISRHYAAISNRSHDGILSSGRNTQLIRKNTSRTNFNSITRNSEPHDRHVFYCKNPSKPPMIHHRPSPFLHYDSDTYAHTPIRSKRNFHTPTCSERNNQSPTRSERYTPASKKFDRRFPTPKKLDQCLDKSEPSEITKDSKMSNSSRKAKVFSQKSKNSQKLKKMREDNNKSKRLYEKFKMLVKKSLEKTNRHNNILSSDLSSTFSDIKTGKVEVASSLSFPLLHTLKNNNNKKTESFSNRDTSTTETIQSPQKGFSSYELLMSNESFPKNSFDVAQLLSKLPITRTDNLQIYQNAHHTLQNNICQPSSSPKFQSPAYPSPLMVSAPKIKSALLFSQVPPSSLSPNKNFSQDYDFKGCSSPTIKESSNTEYENKNAPEKSNIDLNQMNLENLNPSLTKLLQILNFQCPKLKKHHKRNLLLKKKKKKNAFQSNKTQNSFSHSKSNSVVSILSTLDQFSCNKKIEFYSDASEKQKNEAIVNHSGNLTLRGNKLNPGEKLLAPNPGFSTKKSRCFDATKENDSSGKKDSWFILQEMSSFFEEEFNDLHDATLMESNVFKVSDRNTSLKQSPKKEDKSLSECQKKKNEEEMIDVSGSWDKDIHTNENLPNLVRIIVENLQKEQFKAAKKSVESSPRQTISSSPIPPQHFPPTMNQAMNYQETNYHCAAETLPKIGFQMQPEQIMKTKSLKKNKKKKCDKTVAKASPKKSKLSKENVKMKTKRSKVINDIEKQILESLKKKLNLYEKQQLDLYEEKQKLDLYAKQQKLDVLEKKQNLDLYKKQKLIPIEKRIMDLHEKNKRLDLYERKQKLNLYERKKYGLYKKELNKSSNSCNYRSCHRFSSSGSTIGSYTPRPNKMKLPKRTRFFDEETECRSDLETKLINTLTKKFLKSNNTRKHSTSKRKSSLSSFERKSKHKKKGRSKLSCLLNVVNSKLMSREKKKKTPTSLEVFSEKSDFLNKSNFMKFPILSPTKVKHSRSRNTEDSRRFEPSDLIENKKVKEKEKMKKLLKVLQKKCFLDKSAFEKIINKTTNEKKKKKLNDASKSCKKISIRENQLRELFMLFFQEHVPKSLQVDKAGSLKIPSNTTQNSNLQPSDTNTISSEEDKDDYWKEKYGEPIVPVLLYQPEFLNDMEFESKFDYLRMRLMQLEIENKILKNSNEKKEEEDEENKFEDDFFSKCFFGDALQGNILNSSQNNGKCNSLCCVDKGTLFLQDHIFSNEFRGNCNNSSQSSSMFFVSNILEFLVISVFLKFLEYIFADMNNAHFLEDVPNTPENILTFKYNCSAKKDPSYKVKSIKKFKKIMMKKNHKKLIKKKFYSSKNFNQNNPTYPRKSSFPPFPYQKEPLLPSPAYESFAPLPLFPQIMQTEYSINPSYISNSESYHETDLNAAMKMHPKLCPLGAFNAADIAELLRRIEIENKKEIKLPEEDYLERQLQAKSMGIKCTLVQPNLKYGCKRILMCQEDNCDLDDDCPYELCPECRQKLTQSCPCHFGEHPECCYEMENPIFTQSDLSLSSHSTLNSYQNSNSYPPSNYQSSNSSNNKSMQARGGQLMGNNSNSYDSSFSVGWKDIKVPGVMVGRTNTGTNVIDFRTDCPDKNLFTLPNPENYAFKTCPLCNRSFTEKYKKYTHLNLCNGCFEKIAIIKDTKVLNTPPPSTQKLLPTYTGPTYSSYNNNGPTGSNDSLCRPDSFDKWFKQNVKLGGSEVYEGGKVISGVEINEALKDSEDGVEADDVGNTDDLAVVGQVDAPDFICEYLISNEIIPCFWGDKNITGDCGGYESGTKWSENVSNALFSRRSNGRKRFVSIKTLFVVSKCKQLNERKVRKHQKYYKKKIVSKYKHSKYLQNNDNNNRNNKNSSNNNNNFDVSTNEKCLDNMNNICNEKLDQNTNSLEDKNANTANNITNSNQQKKYLNKNGNSRISKFCTKNTIIKNFLNSNFLGRNTTNLEPDEPITHIENELNRYDNISTINQDDSFASHSTIPIKAEDSTNNTKNNNDESDHNCLQIQKSIEFNNHNRFTKCFFSKKNSSKVPSSPPKTGKFKEELLSFETDDPLPLLQDASYYYGLNGIKNDVSSQQISVEDISQDAYNVEIWKNSLRKPMNIAHTNIPSKRIISPELRVTKAEEEPKKNNLRVNNNRKTDGIALPLVKDIGKVNTGYPNILGGSGHGVNFKMKEFECLSSGDQEKHKVVSMNEAHRMRLQRHPEAQYGVPKSNKTLLINPANGPSKDHIDYLANEKKIRQLFLQQHKLIMDQVKQQRQMTKPKKNFIQRNIKAVSHKANVLSFDNDRVFPAPSPNFLSPNFPISLKATTSPYLAPNNVQCYKTTYNVHGAQKNNHLSSKPFQCPNVNNRKEQTQKLQKEEKNGVFNMETRDDKNKKHGGQLLSILNPFDMSHTTSSSPLCNNVARCRSSSSTHPIGNYVNSITDDKWQTKIDNFEKLKVESEEKDVHNVYQIKGLIYETVGENKETLYISYDSLKKLSGRQKHS